MEYLDVAISIITTLLAIVALQGKSMGFILVFQLLLNSLVVLQFAMTGKLSAAYICALAIVQIVIIYLYQRKGKSLPILLTALFMVGYAVVCALQMSTAYDLLTGAAAWMFALSVVQRRPAVSRLFTLFNGAFWVAFDILSAAYTSLPVHITIFVAAVVSIIRLDRGFWREFLAKRKNNRITP